MKVPFLVASLRKMKDLHITVKDDRQHANGLVDRIDPGEGAKSFEKFRPVFLLCIQNGIQIRRGHVFHLDDFYLRK